MVKLTNTKNLPQEIVRSVQSDSYTRGKSTISATGLLQSPQQRVLAKEYDDKIVLDVSDQIWKLLGTACHYVMEKANEGQADIIAEERMYAQINGWTVSGQFDSMSIKDKTLKDLKVTSAWTVMRAMSEGKIEWEQQLNIYAWLFRQNRNEELEKLEIITVNRDWSLRQKQNSGADYPDSNISVIPIKMWTEQEQKDFIYERVNLHQEAEGEYLISGTLPPCSDVERWKQPDAYRVIKPRRARALRVLATDQEAKDYINKSAEKGLTIEFAKGESRKCKDYCDVSDFCDQYKMEIGNDQ